MKFKNDFLINYFGLAPIPLSIERTMECEILSQQKFRKPILDIGCGEGLFAHILFDEKIDLGIDPDKKELNKATDYNMYLELICCYGNKIPKPDNFFNTIFSNSVLEHIPEIEPVLKEIRRLLSENGDLYLTLPTDYFDRYTIINQILSGLGFEKSATSYRKFYNRFWKHYHFYDLKGWTAIFERNGFIVNSSIEYGSKYVCLKNDFLVPFSLPAFLLKKFFNRWTLFPGIRAAVLRPIAYFVGKSGEKINVKNGGLIFFHLKKV